MTRATAPTLHPWNMRETETARAYQAFERYRDMGAGRSLDRVHREFTGSSPLDVLKQWSTRHDWTERVRAFDAEAARIASARSLNDHTEVRTRQAQLGRMMQARGAQRIGQLDPSTLEAKEARALAVEGAKMEREALGLAQKHEVTGAGGGPVEQVTRVVFEWSDANDIPPDDTDAGDSDAD